MKKTKDAALVWKILEEQIYEQFRIFSIKRSKRVNPRTGKSFDFFLMEGFDWVNIIPITPENNVVFVRQYRHGSDEYTIETPGGTAEPGEDPKVTALRELEEETGYVAHEAHYLGALQPNPAMQKMRMHYYVAYNVTRTKAQKLDAGEDITVFERPLAEINEMIQRGEIVHGLIVAAFMLFNIHRSSKEKHT